MTKKQTGEALTELLTLALLILVVSLYLVGNLASNGAMLAAGAVLLLSGVYQTARRWSVSVMTWLLGLALMLAGLGTRLFLVTVTEINFVTIIMILVGIYLLWQIFGRRK